LKRTPTHPHHTSLMLVQMIHLWVWCLLLSNQLLTSDVWAAVTITSQENACAAWERGDCCVVRSFRRKLGEGGRQT
jgi:hypothetical protein